MDRKSGIDGERVRGLNMERDMDGERDGEKEGFRERER